MAESSVPGAVGERPIALERVVGLYHGQHDDECNCEACNAYDEFMDEVEGSGGAVGEREEPLLDVDDLALFFHEEYWGEANEPHWPRETADATDCEVCWSSAAKLLARLSVNEGGVAPVHTEVAQQTEHPENAAAPRGDTAQGDPGETPGLGFTLGGVARTEAGPHE